MNRAVPINRAVGPIGWRHVGLALAGALLAFFVYRDVLLVQVVRSHQPLGVDFLPLWTGARLEPGRLYDFGYVTAQQLWLYARGPRPFVYPPSALLFLKPFGLLPFWAAYGLLTAGSLTFFVWAARRIGTRPLVLLLAAPPLVLVALAGQLTFLIGGLVMTALSLKGRPWLAGALFAVAGTIKPQLLVLLPVALAFARDWRTFRATGVFAAVIVLASLALGASWVSWVEALPRFNDLILHQAHLLATTLTPYARWGEPSLLLAVPAALGGVWLAFRTEVPAERALALLGGALLIAPYAMNYEITLLIPAVLALRVRPVFTAPFWWLMLFSPPGPLLLCAAMLLLAVRYAGQLPELAAPAMAGAEPQEA